MSMLQILWFVLIGVLFSGYFFLEGFDYGVGMANLTLAHSEAERDQLIKTIGPVWDGNEVWLITAGGAMFASFPYWYASLFSGYYLLLFIILFGLIIRGVSFEFRERVAQPQKMRWNWTLTLGSFIVPFGFGILFISMVQGMPLDANGNMTPGFFDVVNLFSVVGGVALTLLCYLHGLNYIALKTTGPIKERALNYAKLLYYVLYVGLVVFAALLYFRTDFFTLHFASVLSLVVLIVILSVAAHVATFKENELVAFILSGVTLVALVAMLFVGLFPRVMISSISPAYDLLIKTASSSPYTLSVMTVIALTMVPIMLAYTIWVYYIFRKRITHKPISLAEVK